MTQEEEKKNWRLQLELKYALICKNCHRKVLDPSKNNEQQIFTRARCPFCSFNKEHKKSTRIRIAC